MSNRPNNLIAKNIHKDFYKDKVGKINWTERWAKPFHKFIFKENNFNSILDIGCGDGTFLKRCKQNGIEHCVGTDIITVDLGIVKPVNGVRYFNIPASELDFPDRSFDIVTSFECLEHVHIDEVDSTLDRMFSLTKEFLCLSIAHRKSGEENSKGENLHLTVQDWEWWAEKLKKRGFIYSILDGSDIDVYVPDERTFVIINTNPVLYCDLDSTLNTHWKRIKKHTINGVCNYDLAFSREEILSDEPLEGAKEALIKLSKDYKVVILTARPFADAFNITKQWLDNNDFYYDDIIVVNRSKDKLPYLSKGSLFIDDLSRKHENNPPYTVLYNETIEELEKRKLNYILFKGDWSKVMNELGYE
jgi:SAM-dependent methyltransferase